MPVDLSGTGFRSAGFGTPGEREGRGGAGSAFERTVGAGFAGLLNDPLVGAVLKPVAGAFGFDETELSRIEAITNNSTLANFSEGIGSLIGAIGPGLGSFSAARHLIRFGLGKVGERVGLGAAQKFLTREAGSQIVPRSPLALRVPEAAAGSLGFGAEGTARGLAEGESTSDALKRGAINAAIAGTFEGGLIAAGRTPGLQRLFGVSRVKDPEASLTRQDPARLATAQRAEQPVEKVFQDTRAKVMKLAPNVDKPTPAQVFQLRFAQAPKETVKALNKIRSINERVADLGPTTFIESVKDSLRLSEKRFVDAATKNGIQAQKVEREVLALEYQQAFIDRHGVKAAKATLGERTKSSAALTSQIVKKQRRIGSLRQKETAASVDKLITTNLRLKLEDPTEFGPVLTSMLDDLTRFDDAPGAVSRTLNKMARDKFAYGGVVFDGEGIRQMAEKFAIRVAKSPETVSRENGLVLAMLADDVLSASKEARGLTIAGDSLILREFRSLAKARGVKFRNNGKFAEPIRDAYEREVNGGLEGVRADFGDETAAVWGRLMAFKDKMFGGAERLGAAPRITPEIARDQFKVGGVFPQIWRLNPDVRRGKIQANLARAMEEQGIYTGEEALVQAGRFLDKASQNKVGGIKRVGNIDSQRIIPGSTAQKKLLAERVGGKIETDPLIVLQEHNAGVSHRLAFGSRFGADGEVMKAFGDAAVAEGASPSLVNTLITHYSGGQFLDEGVRKLLKMATNVQIMSKLGLSQIPNMSQFVNQTIFGGPRSLAGGIRTITNEQGRATTLKGLGIVDAMGASMGRVIQEDLALTTGLTVRAPLDGVTRGFLN
ncbi:hypothetical protein LCGC14_1646040, partial [marine sediment metagenome]